MDTGRPSQLGQAHQVLLHLEAGHHHQVCQLVNDQYQEGHLLFGLVVEDIDVSDAQLLHLLVAANHLPVETSQRFRNLFGLNDYRLYQVGYAVERGELNPLRVYHQEA